MWTYVLEAAANTGLDVGAPEGSHLPELLRDLDGLVEQQTELPLVTRVTCRRYLAEEVWVGGEWGGGGREMRWREGEKKSKHVGDI